MTFGITAQPSNDFIDGKIADQRRSLGNPERDVYLCFKRAGMQFGGLRKVFRLRGRLPAGRKKHVLRLQSRGREAPEAATRSGLSAGRAGRRRKGRSPPDQLSRKGKRRWKLSPTPYRVYHHAWENISKLCEPRWPGSPC